MTDIDIFTKIFKELLWDGKNISGTGSSLDFTTKVRNELPSLIKKHNIKTILDIPCGDMTWMSTILHNFDDYIGADIVDELLDRNKKLYPDVKFVKLDLIKDDLPEVDLVICRDIFIHFTNDNVNKAIANIKKSKSKYLLATTHLSASNEEININNITRYRPINLEHKPFNLPKPIDSIHEYDFNEGYLALWDISKIN